MNNRISFKKKPDFSRLLIYISPKAIFYIEKWLSPFWFHLTIKNPRETKLGDYRLPRKNEPHRISINAGMPSSLFFLTLTHEIAHLIVFDKYSIKIAPHGKEWKNIFSEMIMESLSVYEEDLKPLLIKYAKNPKASFYADSFLSEYFNKVQNPNSLLLKDLNLNRGFKIKNKVFYKLEKVKTRYICIEKKTKKRYLIAGNVPIEEIGCILNEE